MERLTKRREDGVVISAIECPNGCKYLSCSMAEGYSCDHQCEADVMCKLAEYEDAEEQGLLLRLPCKVGDTVYLIRTLCDGKETKVIEDFVVCGFVLRESRKFIFNEDGHVLEFSLFGEKVFLTKEEAEKKLAEMGGE